MGEELWRKEFVLTAFICWTIIFHIIHISYHFHLETKDKRRQRMLIILLLIISCFLYCRENEIFSFKSILHFTHKVLTLCVVYAKERLFIFFNLVSVVVVVASNV